MTEQSPGIEEREEDNKGPSPLMEKSIIIAQKAKAFSQDLNAVLGNRDKLAHEYFPDAQTLEALAPKDREAVLRLIGRMGSSMGVFHDWSEQFVNECDALVRNAAEKEKVEEIVRPLFDLCALHMGSEMNTNTAGDSRRHQMKLNTGLAKALQAAGDSDALRALLNPYDLAQGDSYYVPHRDRNGRVTLEEKHIGEVSIDGADALIDDEGKTLTIPEFNFQLNLNRSILRNGSNYFGGLEYPEELRGLTVGDMIEFVNPMFPEANHSCEYLGSNEKELQAKYGLAYMPFVKELIRFRVRHEGKEIEATWGQNIEVKVTKRSKR